MGGEVPRSVEDIEGPWQEPAFDSSLIQRCRENWRVPVASLSDQMLATFLRQKIAIQLVLPEAERRVELGTHDDSEIYDDELRDAVKQFERA